MRTKIVAGNWKMNLTTGQAHELVAALTASLDGSTKAEVVVCPPYLSIPHVLGQTKGTPVKVGAQDAFWMDQGAFTGHVSPVMLKDIGVGYCIVGHSETRGRFGKLEVPASTLGHFAETDETVNLKLKALISHGLTPILCVGETLQERQAGQTEAVIEAQVKGALAGITPEQVAKIIVAYEPVWAIGTGETCETGEANRVCRFVRECLTNASSEQVAAQVRVLYGGSVKSSNSEALFSQSDIDGGLVGGASLDAADFLKIIASAGSDAP